MRFDLLLQFIIVAIQVKEHLLVAIKQQQKTVYFQKPFIQFIKSFKVVVNYYLILL